MIAQIVHAVSGVVLFFAIFPYVRLRGYTKFLTLISSASFLMCSLTSFYDINHELLELFGATLFYFVVWNSARVKFLTSEDYKPPMFSPVLTLISFIFALKFVSVSYGIIMANAIYLIAHSRKQVYRLAGDSIALYVACTFVLIESALEFLNYPIASYYLKFSYSYILLLTQIKIYREFMKRPIP